MVRTSVRVRFAPSPTGMLHLGGARTALYNLLFARAKQGSCVLRVEDTDKERYVPGSLERLELSLKWLKLDFDEGPTVGGAYGPYLQSERLRHYREVASRLVKDGAAYCCFCSKERLHSLRSQGKSYDGLCRRLSVREAQERARVEQSHTVRLRVPCEGHTEVRDSVYGDVVVRHRDIEDQVLLKSDGYPTYHLANVVDDHHMEITHVLRGEEWLLSTAKHLLLYSALNWKPPQFAHLPLLLSSDGGKLSKRNQAAFVETYQERGFLPEAVLNFVALLGWHPPDHSELLTLEDMTRLFSLRDLNKRGAMVDEEKLVWLNKQHFKRRLGEERELGGMVEWLRTRVESCHSAVLSPGDYRLEGEYLTKVLLLLEERTSLIPEIPKEASYFWTDPDLPTITPSLHESRAGLPDNCLSVLSSLLESCDPFSRQTIDSVMRSTAHQLSTSYSKLMKFSRVILTGTQKSPGLPALMEVLGKDTVLRRIDHVRDYIE